MRSVAVLLLLAGAAWAQEYGDNIRLKIPITGETRKGVVFFPKNLAKGQVLPLLVAIPNTKGKAYLEIGQWQKLAYEHGFAVFSTDIITSSLKGWHPNDAVEMQRDMEAVTVGVEMAFEAAKNANIVLDPTATVITGHSGGTYLTIWLGIRRPDLFLGVCGRSCMFYAEAVKFGRLETVEPNYDQYIFLYHGELDAPDPKRMTALAKRTLDAAGFRRVEHRVIPKMTHESKPEVFMEWYLKILKKTAKGRKEAVKVAHEVAVLKPQIEAKKPGVYGKLHKLVEREKKAGFGDSARREMAKIDAAVKAAWKRAEDLEADHQLKEAAAAFKRITKEYMPLQIAKDARKRRGKILKSDAYKALELLAKAKGLIARDKRDKAIPILEKIVSKYKKTLAAEQAQALLSG